MSDEREEREGRRERALRLDFFIAIGALVISVLTTVTLIYQTHVISDQYAATIWPYLSVKDQVESNEERLTLTNDGLGPALVRSAQLTVDGKNLASWSDYLRMLSGRLPRGAKISAVLNTVGPATTMRPGDSQVLFDVRYSSSALTTAIISHRIEVSFCYCSLNKSCWLMRSTPSSNVPADNTPVHVCTVHQSIDSYAVK